MKAPGPLNPYPRAAPPGLPFRLDVATLRTGMNLTLTCDLGDVDLLGEVPGGTYETVRNSLVTINLGRFSVPLVSLETLIWLKRAAGRPRDFEHIAELEVLLEERRRHGH